MWLNNQLTNFAFVLRSGVKNFSWIGNFANNPFDRCFSSAATLSEEGPFRARLTFAPKSSILTSMYENAKTEPFPSVAGHVLRSIFKEKELSTIGAVLKSDSPVTMLHDVIVEAGSAITQTFALAGSDIDVETLGARVIIRTVCLLTVPTLLKTWKVLEIDKQNELLGLFIKNPNRYPHYEDPSKLRELVAYTSIKSSDGSHITIPIQVLADGSRFYNFSEINKISTKKVILKDTLSEQGVVGLPVYYIADSSEITINRLPQPDAFMDRPEVLKQLCEMKESEVGGIFVSSDFQKYIKYDKTFASRLIDGDVGSQDLSQDSPLIDAIETVLIDN